MKRDDDFIRQLFIDLESSDRFRIRAVLGPDATQDEIKRNYHVNLLVDAGLMTPIGTNGLFRMTSQGHDYLEAMRDEGLWAATKEAVAKTGGNATLEIMKSLATVLLKKEDSRTFGN